MEGSAFVWSPNGKTFDVNAVLIVEDATNAWRGFRMRYAVSGTAMTCSVNIQYNASGAVVAGNARLLAVIGIK